MRTRRLIVTGTLVSLIVLVVLGWLWQGA